jgi:uncharacterized membrane protein
MKKDKYIWFNQDNLKYYMFQIIIGVIVMIVGVIMGYSSSNIQMKTCGVILLLFGFIITTIAFDHKNDDRIERLESRGKKNG